MLFRRNVFLFIGLWLQSVLWMLLTSTWQDAVRQETNARDTEVVFCISWFKTHLQVLTLESPWNCFYNLWLSNRPPSRCSGGQRPRFPELWAGSGSPCCTCTVSHPGKWGFCRIPALGSVLKGCVQSYCSCQCAAEGSAQPRCHSLLWSHHILMFIAVGCQTHCVWMELLGSKQGIRNWQLAWGDLGKCSSWPEENTTLCVLLL